MMSVPSAFWIDNKAKIRGRDRLYTLEGILQNAASNPTPPLCVFVFYDLPNRDCNAKASNGEISDARSGSEQALREYKREYVDPFVEVLAQYSNVPVALIIEPDSLGNVISNEGSNGCTRQVVDNYKEGISYAVTTIAARAPHVAIYVDAAHGGWMGFEHNAQAFVDLISSMHILHLIRGFSTNVANYQTLGMDSICPPEAFELAGKLVHGATRGVAQWCHDLENKAATKPLTVTQKACCEADPCRLMNIGSGGSTELSYAQTLQQHFIQSTGWAPKFVIDTGRNGAHNDQRSSCSSWCNVRGAGAGHAPTMNTGLPEIVDAFFWLKTPGESDGCTRILPSGEQCARFDASCEGTDSIGGPNGRDEPRSPEAGMWFEYQARMLARNANLRLEAPGALDSMWGAHGSTGHVTVDVLRDATRTPPTPQAQQPGWTAQPTSVKSPPVGRPVPVASSQHSYSYDDSSKARPRAVPPTDALKASAMDAQGSDYQPGHAINVVSRVDTVYDFEFPTFVPPPSPPEPLILGSSTADDSTSSHHGKNIILGVGTWLVLGLMVMLARRHYAASKEEERRRRHDRGRSRRRSSTSSTRGSSTRHSQENDGLVDADEEGLR